MKRNISIYIIALIGILFASCEKEIEFDQELIAPKLVINSFIETDSLINVTIATSKAIPGVKTDFGWIDNATVTLFVDGKETEILTPYEIEYPEQEEYEYYNWDDTPKPTKAYISATTVEEGKTYKIVVDHPDYEQAYSETTIPVSIKPHGIKNSIEKVKTYYYGDMQVEGAVVKFKLSDPDNELNYYRLVANYTKGEWHSESNWGGEDTTGVISIDHGSINYFIEDDPILNPNSDDANEVLFGSPSNRYNLFTDEFIQGKEHEISISLPLQQIIWTGEGEKAIERHEAEFYKITITLQTLSREAYYYMKASYEQQWYDGELFTEPVQAFSNVENGVGIFAGYSKQSFTVKGGQYPIDGIEYVGHYDN